MLKPGFILLLLVALSSKAQQVSFVRPAKGFTSWQPASDWEHALLSGNGTIGAMVMGQPHDETIMLSHAQLYLPQKRSAKLINQGAHLDRIRQLLVQGRYKDAANLPQALREKENYNDQRDPFIPAFDIRIQQEASNILRYQRAVNFETGEAVVEWQDDIGTFSRKVFVSRADSIVVLSIKGTAKINCRIRFQARPVEWNQWKFVNEHITAMKAGIDGNFLTFSTEFRYKHKDAIHAFEGLGRLTAVNGTVMQEGRDLVVSQADEVLLLVAAAPDFNTDHTKRMRLPSLLTNAGEKYQELLSKHAVIHGGLFNRVSFDLFSDASERDLHSEEILLKARLQVPLALTEKTFDASRYNIISATGTNPPNLQGLWTGTWTAPWTGGMTHDGNLATAIAVNLPGRMPELMDAFFRYHENLLDDYRAAAKQLYRTRGIHIPAQATTTGIDTDFGPTWCLTFWTGGAGWTASFFWDHYQYTMDTAFLSERAYPFMKEALLFYEDFLQTGKDGKLVFNPSYSPENDPANTKSQAAINATMDVMIAKELIRNCMAASVILNTDAGKRERWKAMLEKMPSYEISKEGALREWLWKNMQENFSHRHASHLYALFNEVAPEFRKDEALRNAARRVIVEKMKFREKESGGEMAFGLVQLGLAAAHLGEREQAAQIVEWLSSKYWSSGFGSYHNVGHLFNTDISGGLPALITQMLAYSESGFLSLLPALPAAWKKGKIEGMLLRGNIHLKTLEWGPEEIRVVLQSATPQELLVQLPYAMKQVAVSGAKAVQAKDGRSVTLQLEANKEVV